MANYIGWKIALSHIIAAKNVQNLYENDCYRYLISGVDESDNLGLLDGAVGSMYIRHINFTVEEKEQLQEMVRYFRAAFKLLIPNIDWMDTKTAKEAEAKLDAMKAYIAYPSEYLEKAEVDKYYEGININLFYLLIL